MIDKAYLTCKTCNGFAQVCSKTGLSVDICSCNREGKELAPLKWCPTCQPHKQ